MEPSLAEVDGIPYVAWKERDADQGNFEIRVARLNVSGTDWEQPWTGVDGTSGGINHDTDQFASEPSLVAIGDVPYVAWTEQDAIEGNFEIRVARLVGTGWEEVVGGDSPVNRSDSQEAGQPSLAAIGGVPHVAWREQDTGGNFEIRVASLGESSWEEVSSEADATGGGINRAGDQNAGQPNLTAVAGIPHVAWREQHGAEDDSNFEIRVAKLDGSTWEEISSEADAGDGGINRANDQEARDPSVTAVGSTPHVAWRESDDTNDELRVASFDETTANWAEISSAASETSGGINQAGEESAEQPTLAAIAGVPYVAWSEDDGPNNEIRVSRLNAAGTAWEQVVAADSPINQADDQDARDASLTAIAGVPHVAWSEDDDANDELRVSRLEPEFTAQTATPSSAGATLVADVHSYGIAYAVGFQFGPGLGSNTSTVTTSTGSQNVSVSRQVTGLSPSTGYQFRPFAMAGVPEPRVLGSTESFTTLAAPPPPAPGNPSPGDPAPGEPAPTPDTEGPELELTGKRKQELSNRVTVTATCIDEPCGLEAAGTVALPGVKSKGASKAVKLGTASAEVGQDEPRKLSLKLSRKTFKAADRALDDDDTASAKLTITATDAAGNETVKTWKVKLVG